MIASIFNAIIEPNLGFKVFDNLFEFMQNRIHKVDPSDEAVA